MAKELVTDALWEVIEPLLPKEPPKPNGGRPRIDDRAALTGILFVLKSGIPWEMLPQEMGCGSGMTCWRRLKEWHEAGVVWEELHRTLLDRLGKADEIDWERASLDSASVAVPGGGQKTGPNPTDKGKQGLKRHVVVDRNGIPLSVIHSAANVHDSKVARVDPGKLCRLPRRSWGSPISGTARRCSSSPLGEDPSTEARPTRGPQPVVMVRVPQPRRSDGTVGRRTRSPYLVRLT